MGAGPTGLMAANQLMRFGIDFIIVDKKSGPTKESRAILVTSRSLEIYQQMGISQHATTNGVPVKLFNLFYDGKRKAEVKIGEIGKGRSEFSYMLAFEQSKNEELLSEQIYKAGKVIHWDHEFMELIEYKEHINARIKTSKEILTIKADYLIACDGAKSPVRHQLNFSFKGGTYAHKFFVVDAVMQWDLEYDKIIIAPSKKSFCAFLPMQGEKTYRVIGTLPIEFENKENITFEEIEHVVTDTIKVKLKFEAVNWLSIYKLHHRGVDHFKQEKVFLAGDSAHIHSPVGGQGMNTGLQDAYNLCWKLAFVIKYGTNTKLLDTYNEERLPFARLLLKFTDRGFNMMTSTNWFVRIFRKYVAMNVAGFAMSLPAIKRLAFKTISQTAYSYKNSSLSKNKSKQALKFKAGDRLPYIDTIESSDRFYELFQAPSFHLLFIDSGQLKKEIAEKLTSVFPFPIKLIESRLSNVWKNFGVQHQLFVLVRPDNYIAFISDSFDVVEINNYLQEYFHVQKA